MNRGEPLLLGSLGDMKLTTATHANLSTALEDGSDMPVIGTSSIEVTSDLCATADRWFCVKYVVISSLVPPFRDVTTANDWACEDVSHLMACNDGKSCHLY